MCAPIPIADLMRQANAADADGTIAKVEFYNGTTLLGTATAAPYSYIWSNVPVGSYSLKAIATDTLNATTTSSAVSVTVNTGVAQAYYIHTDHLDTPRQITDTSGNIVWQWDNTDPFGNNVPNENPNGAGLFSFNLRFPGQYADRETNTYYNINRDYNPATGRYIESDPIGLEGGINTYTYVNGNPLSFVDPNGLRPVPCKDGSSGCDDGKGNENAPPVCVTGECAADLPPAKPDNRSQCEKEKGECKMVCKIVTTPVTTIANIVVGGGLVGTAAGFVSKKEVCELVCN